VLFDGAGEGEVVGGLDDCAHGGDKKLCLTANRIVFDVEHVGREDVNLRCGAVGGDCNLAVYYPNTVSAYPP
jgi:hypothetical protein